MDYSKMSDFEINKAVAVAQGYDINVAQQFGMAGLSIVRTTEAHKDYCNNPADAWTIITENNISIILDNPTMPCATASARDLFNDSDPDIHVAYDKPLRAAMIVFLMMQESANVQDNPAR